MAIFETTEHLLKLSGAVVSKLGKAQHVNVSKLTPEHHWKQIEIETVF